MPLAANHLIDSLIVVMQLPEKGDCHSVEDECLIIPMERLVANSLDMAGSSEQPPKQCSGNSKSTHDEVINGRTSKLLVRSVGTAESRSQRWKDKERVKAIEQNDSSKQLIQQGRELPEVHHGIATSSIPVPFKTILKNWKDVPKLHQYSPTQLQVVFHRRTGEVETVTPGRSAQNILDRTNEITKALETGSSMSNFEPTRNLNGSSSGVTKTPHETNNSDKMGKPNSSHKNIVAALNASLPTSKTQDFHAQTETNPIPMTLAKFVQTNNCTENFTNGNLDLITKNVSVQYSQDMKTQESQTRFAEVFKCLEQSSQTEIKYLVNTAMNSGIQVNLPVELDATTSCPSCSSLKGQIQGFEEKMERVVELLSVTTVDRNEQERRVQELVKENSEIKYVAKQHEAHASRYNWTVDSITEKLESEMMEKVGQRSLSKINELEKGISRLQHTLDIKNEEFRLQIEANDELQTRNSRVEASHQLLQFQLEEFKKNQEEELSKCQCLVGRIEDEKSQLQTKVQQLQVQLEYFQRGMSRLRNAIDRPVTDDQNSIRIPDNKVEEILMRAGTIIAKYPDSENNVAKINNYLSDLQESVASINSDYGPNDHSEVEKCSEHSKL